MKHNLLLPTLATLATAYNLLPTTHHSLPKTYSLLTTHYYSLLSTLYLLPTTYYLLPTTYCLLLPTTYYLLPTTYYLLPTAYYYLLPTTYHSLRRYDRTIWSKLRDPWTLIFLYIAASPSVWVRGGFFTLYLLCILPEREEFQVTKFILGLKGTQFLSGMLKLVTLCLSFWQCSVTIIDENGCRMEGPGVGKPALNDLVMLLWLQVVHRLLHVLATNHPTRAS